MAYEYQTSLAVEGTVKRQLIPAQDKGWVRKRSLDSMISAQIFRQPSLPECLLYATTEGLRPEFSSLYLRSSLLSSLADLWNAVLQKPATSSSFVQIVDEQPGLDDPTRIAFEQSLIRVKPFALDQFEHLLETQEKVYASESYIGAIADKLGRVYALEKSRFRDNRRNEKAAVFVEALFHASQSRILRLSGVDCQVQDFRIGLNGISDLFRQWERRREQKARPASAIDRVYVYSHLKGLLPGCWEELRVRGFEADQIRLPQWVAHANAISSYVEFLLADCKSAAYIFLAQNGRCHFAEWES